MVVVTTAEATLFFHQTVVLAPSGHASEPSCPRKALPDFLFVFASFLAFQAT